MKLYVYTITERCSWKEDWETKITGVTDEPVSYFYCNEAQVWEDDLLVGIVPIKELKVGTIFIKERTC